MSNYRTVQTRFWNDKDVLKSVKDCRYLLLYLITNKHINNSGVYELPLTTITYETAIPSVTVQKLFTNGLPKNVFYDFENEMVFVKNARVFQPGGNPAKVEKGILNEFNQSTKTPLWNLFLEAYPYFKGVFPTVTEPFPKGSLPLPIPIPIKSNDLNEGKFGPEILEIIAYLNDKADKDFKFIESNMVNIRARLNEKDTTVADCKLVIDNKVARWKCDAKMNEYLRPITLFGKKNFDNYRNAKPQAEKKKETPGSAKRRQIQEILEKSPGAPEPIRIAENGL